MRDSLFEQEIISGFNKALKEGQFRMYLQPIALENGQTMGAEALVRWHKPDGSIIMPAQFIPTLEHAGLIHNPDMYIWECAVKQLAQWKGTAMEELVISVNMSANDFYNVDICPVLTDLLRRYNVNGSRLRVEITETALPEDPVSCNEVIARLHRHGIIMEIDDFGKGYSSISLLKDIHADVLKIDMSLLREIDSKSQSRIILESVIKMAESLGMDVVTEGVETAAQLASLKAMGCRHFQGYYFSRPVTAEEFENNFVRGYSAMTTIKRALAALCCMLTLLLCTIGASAAVEYGGNLVIGVPTDRCPIFYQDADTGEIEGIGADLMRAAAENAGYRVSLRKIKEATLKDALDSNEYDIVMPFGSAITSSAGKPTVVSENLFQTPFTLVTEESESIPRLNNLRVGMLRSLGGVAETVRELYPGMTISMYETMPQCVKALRDGDVDALLHNSYVWSYVLQKPSYSDLSVRPSTMFSMDFRAGTLDTPDGRMIIERLNNGIAEITDTRRQAVILDYTSRQLYRYDLSDYIYSYRWFLLALASLFILLIIFVARKLRAFRKAGEEQVRRMRDRDPLTGVLSMEGFRRRAEELLHAYPDAPYLISYNNIRNFKFVNDSYGRAAGDDLLRFWSARSVEFMTDEEAIGRTSADHFIVLRRINGMDQMSRDDRDIFEPIRSYFTSRGKETRLQICSGIYVLTAEDHQNIDVDRMLDYARVAEERVRNTRKDGYEFYNPDQWEKGRRVTDICGHLHNAMKSGEIKVWYQPQIDYGSGSIIGAEALCRWHHGKLGWLRPAEFIPILEESDLIFDLDSYIWDTVCRDLQRWNEQGETRCVSVNLSRGDLREDRNIPGHFYSLIQKYGLDPLQLRIEITESAYVEDPELLIRTTVKLREFGFNVEMDDFGSGYSSLNMLKEVPVDRIKLDLKFLTGTGDSEKGRIIVSHMVQMVHSLGMSMIAEGVENISQASFLESRGCFEMQGFFFYKPMPTEEFEAMMKQKASDDK